MSKGKILVVDDEPDIVRSLSIRLGSVGYEVSMATDGLNATRKAIDEQPDLILMDIDMPGSNGHEVVERLGNISETSHIPVIYLTACTADEDFRKAREGGVRKFITKPFDSDILLAAVEDQIERSRMVAR